MYNVVVCVLTLRNDDNNERTKRKEILCSLGKHESEGGGEGGRKTENSLSVGKVILIFERKREVYVI